MLKLRIHENLLGVCQEYWDLCFDETKGVFSVLHTNYFDDSKDNLSCAGFVHWIAARLRRQGFKSIRTQNNKYLAAIEISKDKNAAGKGVITHLCFDDVKGIFYVLETVTVVTDKGQFLPQENVHQPSNHIPEVAHMLWNKAGFVRMTDVVD